MILQKSAAGNAVISINVISRVSMITQIISFCSSYVLRKLVSVYIISQIGTNVYIMRIKHLKNAREGITVKKIIASARPTVFIGLQSVPDYTDGL